MCVNTDFCPLHTVCALKLSHVWAPRSAAALIALPIRNPDGLGGTIAARRNRDNDHRDLMMSNTV